jgi:hypothetical protein
VESQVFVGGTSKQKTALHFRGASSQQTAASTSVNQMFAPIMFLTKTYSGNEDKK